MSLTFQVPRVSTTLFGLAILLRSSWSMPLQQPHQQLTRLSPPTAAAAATKIVMTRASSADTSEGPHLGPIPPFYMTVTPETNLVRPAVAELVSFIDPRWFYSYKWYYLLHSNALKNWKECFSTRRGVIKDDVLLHENVWAKSEDTLRNRTSFQIVSIT